jgi:CRISPR-associated endonuclease Csn1
MRYGESQTAKAILEGNAEYLGYLVEGDEIRVRLAGQTKLSRHLQEFVDFFEDDAVINPAVSDSWVIAGFSETNEIRLRPRFLSSEGLEALMKLGIGIPAGVKDVLDTRGWRAKVNTLMRLSPQIIRRSTLGEIRWKSRHGLDTSWSIDTPRNE